MQHPEVIKQLESLKQYTERLSGSNYTGKTWKQDTEALAYAIEFLKEHECDGNIKLIKVEMSPEGNILTYEAMPECTPYDIAAKLTGYESAQDQSGLVEG